MNATVKSVPAPEANADRPRYLRTLVRHRKDNAKARTARMSAEAREAEGLTQRDVAPAVGVDQATFARSEMPGEGKATSTVELIMGSQDRLARGWAVRMLRALTVEVDPAKDVHGERHAMRLASVLTECTDAPRVLATAMADGEFTLDELRAIAREADEAALALDELRGWVGREIERRRETA